MKLSISALCSTLFALASGSSSSRTDTIVQRLREFTDNIKLSLPADVDAASCPLGEDDRENLIANAVSYAIGEGDTFQHGVETVGVVSKGCVSPKEYEDITWESVKRLFAGNHAQVIAPAPKARGSRIPGLPLLTSTSYRENLKRGLVTETTARKRPASVEPESRPNAAVSLLAKLDEFMRTRAVRTDEVPSDGLRHLAKLQLWLLGKGELKSIEANFELLRAVGAPDKSITYTFERIHKHLNPAAYTEELPEIGQVSRPFVTFTEETFSENVVDFFCKDPLRASLFPEANRTDLWKKISKQLERDAEEGKRQNINGIVEIWRNAGVHTHAIARILKAACAKLI